MNLRRSPAEKAQIPTAAVDLRRRAFLAIASTLVALATLALTATPAFADRTYDSQIGGFVNPAGVTLDSADHVWVSDTGNKGLISEYDAYPSQTLLSQQSGGGQFKCGGFYILSLAVGSNGDLYAADSCGLSIDIFEPSGYFLPPPWTGFGSNLVDLYVATDNSGQPSDGRVYLSTPEENVYPYVGAIKAFDPNHNEVNFTAAEPYVSGSEIIGTPSGYFGSRGLTRIDVDGNGNFYAVDQTRNEVDEFESSGKFVRAFTGTGAPGSFAPSSVAIDPTNEDVLIVSGDVVDEFSSAGTYLGQISGVETPTGSFGELSGGIAVNSNGYVYLADHFYGAVDIFSPRTVLPKITYGTPTNPTPASEKVEAVVDPHGGGPVTECRVEYGTDRAYSVGSVPCSSEHFSELTSVTAALTGLTSETTYHYRVVVSNANGTSNGRDHTFTPHWVPNLTTESATELTNTSATLEGAFIGNGDDTHYYFEYGTDTDYGESTPVPPGADAGSPNGLKHLSTGVTGLQPLVNYHYRIVATNALGTTYGQDRTFTTLTEPSIGGLSSSNVTSTTAVLHATINPQGANTRYHFEYGSTTSYGSSATGSEGEITDNLFSEHEVEVQLKNLQAGVTYHFRIVAENPYGTPASEDQTFGFQPPNCPNSHLRQITHSSSLPDCRAYELVSPSEAGGATLYAQGPNSPIATNPSRFAFGSTLGAVPGAGNPPDTAKGDLYVATRTDLGWVTKYVGLSGSETYSTNGPPDEARSTSNLWLAGPAGVRTDTSMDRFIDWNDGIPWDKGGPKLDPPEFAPHVWAADGSALEEWPNLSGHTGAEIDPVFEQSADFSHFVFQAGSSPSFSLIDDDTVAHTSAEVSIAPGGGPIPIQPGDTTPDQESLRVPAVSTNGSHILISARAEPQEHPMVRQGYGEAPCALEKTEQNIREGYTDLICPLQPSQLYMRIDDAVTYEIAPGHAVSYLGETPDGSKVYFTSEEHLTGEDEGHGGASLYMWSQQGEEEEPPHPLTLISKANPDSPPGAGDTAACTTSWTSQCSIAPFVNNSYSDPFTEGYLGGNGLSDNFIASENGDIYFFSPEQLAGPRGVRGQENLYDYRNGALQYLASFAPQPFCNPELGYCSAGPVIRMQVSPDDTHIAFLTADRVTSYSNTGHTEMYTYNPSTEALRCVSCLPSGAPPTTNVFASSNGLFMTNDGRTFFSTGDPLVPQDTDGLIDVYEFVEGHAQLISSGTSATDEGPVSFAGPPALSTAGLVGVSTNGTDVYFSTLDTLVGQDRNGSQLKFYDARTDGGFPYSSPPAPCEAADECHGPGSPSEAPFRSGSGAELGTGGNQTPDSSASHHKHRKSHRKSGHRERHTGRRHA